MSVYLKKIMATMMLCFLSLIGLSGCGKAGDAEAGTDKIIFNYTAGFQDLDAENMNASCFGVSGEHFYFISQDTDKETQRQSNYLYIVQIGGTEVTKILLDAEDDDEAKLIAMTLAPDGSLILLAGRNALTDAQTAASSPTGASVVYELWTLGADGQLVNTVNLSEILGEQQFEYLQYMETDNEGNLYLADSRTLIVLNPERTKLFDLEADSRMNSMGRAGDGTILVSTYANPGTDVRPVDFVNKKLGEAYPGITTKGYGRVLFGQGTGNTFLYSFGNQVSIYDTSSKTSTELFDWLDADINSDDLRFFTQTADGRILAMTMEERGEKQHCQLAVLTDKNAPRPENQNTSREPESGEASADPSGRTVLTLGTMIAYSDLKELVVDFNKTSEDYRIELKEYQEGLGSDAYDEAVSRMNADVVGGNCPDILDLSSGNSGQYMVKGLLEDLNPFLEKDPELDRGDYVENVLDAYQVDGKLYGLFPTFYIDTVIAKASDMGGKTGWTLDEMIDYINHKPEDSRVFQFTSNDEMLLYITRMNQERYVDWITGECNFDSGDFTKLLEFSARFPAREEVDYDADENIGELLQSGEVLLINTSIGAMTDYQMYTILFGEPVTFIGYPAQEGQGSSILTGGTALGMSSRSQNKDGVWQFLRTYLTKEYQETIDQNNQYGFPVMKSALETRFQEAMTPEYYEDENGGQAERPKSSMNFYGAPLEIFTAAQEDVDAVKSLIERVDKFEGYDAQMMNIILEEAGPFFKGQKTAGETADIIQSRMKIYVNENR